MEQKDASLWPQVYRRTTYDRDTRELLADEDPREISNAELYRALEVPRRLEVVFHLDRRAAQLPVDAHNLLIRSHILQHGEYRKKKK